MNANVNTSATPAPVTMKTADPLELAELNVRDLDADLVRLRDMIYGIETLFGAPVADRLATVVMELEEHAGTAGHHFRRARAEVADAWQASDSRLRANLAARSTDANTMHAILVDAVADMDRRRARTRNDRRQPPPAWLDRARRFVPPF